MRRRNLRVGLTPLRPELAGFFRADGTPPGGGASFGHAREITEILHKGADRPATVSRETVLRLACQMFFRLAETDSDKLGAARRTGVILVCPPLAELQRPLAAFL